MDRILTTTLGPLAGATEHPSRLYDLPLYGFPCSECQGDDGFCGVNTTGWNGTLPPVPPPRHRRRHKFATAQVELAFDVNREQVKQKEPKMPGKDVFKTIAACIKELLPSVADHQVNAQMSLKDLGANSIDRVDILLAVTEALAVDMPISELTGAKTIGDIRDLFENKIKATG